MKKTIALLLCAAMILGIMPIGTFAAGEDSTLLAWYKFDDSDLSRVTDYSGKGNHAILHNGAAYGEGTRGGKALYLKDDSDAYVEVPSGILDDANGMTISCWAKRTSTKAWERVFDFGEDSGNYIFACMQHFQNNGLFILGAKANDQAEIAKTDTKIDENVWTHIAATWDDNSIKFYINGKLRGTLKAGTTKFSAINFVKNFIGKSHYEDPYFKGFIDDFRLYGSVKTDEEIASLYSDNIEDSAAVKMDADALNLPEMDAVSTNLVLPTKGIMGSTITWQSSNTGVVSTTGVVTRPAASTKVTLTATIKRGSVSQTKTFSPYVIAKTTYPYTLNIDGDKKGVTISDNLIGLFFEDINWGADGGLFAELIHNASFDLGNKLYGWEKIGAASLTEENETPIHVNNPGYATITAQKAGDGIANKGFTGVTVVEGDTYDFSVFAKSESYNKTLTIQVLDNAGKVIAEGITDNVTAEWKKHSLRLSPNASAKDGKLAVVMNQAGSVDVDMVSLIPTKRYGNTTMPLRYDLVKALADIKPKFMRFPGGCVVEGDGFNNMYNWKDTVGPREERKAKPNLIWNVDRGGFIYNQSYGLGFYEYFVLCEELGMEPLPVVNAGMYCQFKGNDQQVGVPLDELQPYIDDAIDLIEFANGDVNTKWGGLRAQMGHPEPFNMKYLAVGNENARYVYRERYNEFHQQIKKLHPEIKLIASSSIQEENRDGAPVPDSTMDLPVIKNKEYDLVDQHFYPGPDFFFNDKYYDNYDRNDPKVFAGEYAAHDSSKSNNLYTAISEAAFLTGIERNGDIVELACYAPLLAKIDNNQWAPDLIWFNNEYTLRTPNYYVQSMFSRNTGDYVVPHKFIKTTESGADASGSVGFASWGTQVEYDDLVVTDNATGKVLYENHFDDPADISNWEIRGGTWVIEDGKMKITSNDAGCNIVLKNHTFTNYSVSVKAKKTGGGEGFIVTFGYKDPSNFYYYNLGGWGNSASAVEREDNTGKKRLTTVSHEAIRTDVEYTLKVTAGADRLSFSRNDTEVAKVENTPDYKPMYSMVSRDEENGDYIVKLVNSSPLAKDVNIKLNGVSNINPTAYVTEMHNDDSKVENSIANPYAIAPKTYQLTNASNDFAFNAKPFSFSVIRISTKEKAVLASAKLSANHIAVNSAARLELTDGKLSDGATTDLVDATVTYHTDKPDIVHINDFGMVTVTDSTKKADVNVWATVSMFGTEIKTDPVTLTIDKEYQPVGIVGAEYSISDGVVSANASVQGMGTTTVLFVLYDGDGRLVECSVKAAQLSKDIQKVETSFNTKVETGRVKVFAIGANLVSATRI